MRHSVNIIRTESRLRPSVLVVILIATTVTCLLPQQNALGQRRGRAGSHKKSVIKKDALAGVTATPATPIPVADPALERLPMNYVGESGVAIYSTLEKYKKQFVKSQFETTAAFRERINALLPQIRFSSGKTASDRLSFVIFDAGESYDADRQVFTLKLKTDSEYFDIYYPKELLEAFESGPREKPDYFLNLSSALNDGFISVSLAHSSHPVGSSVGQNAFGVRRRFSIWSYTALKLAMWRTNISRYDEAISFRATPAEARAASGYVFLAFNGKLRFPFIRNESDMDEATLTDLEESHYHRYHVFLEPDSLVAYNGRTGEVLGSVDLPLKDKRTSVGSEIMLKKRPHSEPKSETVLVPEPKSTPPADVREPPPSSAPKPDPLRRTIVSGGVLNGKAISKPQPAYPPIAKAARAQGTVTVQILVDEDGSVISASAVSGHPLLQQAAVAAARHARFEPSLSGGKPVKVSGIITYNFVLQ
ncbi:MAG: periplasmic protein TonB [Acidobacteriota bacterium]|jgi:TonB family protein|nr:periplasmic protein TonB [Acidobacteriota bacterium]